MSTSIYKALADPTRRKVLELLRERDMRAGEIAEHFDCAKPTLSRHLGVLREADLLSSRRDGAAIIYSLKISVVEEALMELMKRLHIDQLTVDEASTQPTKPQPLRKPKESS